MGCATNSANMLVLTVLVTERVLATTAITTRSTMIYCTSPVAAATALHSTIPAPDYGTVYHHSSDIRIYRTGGSTKDIFVWIVRPV